MIELCKNESRVDCIIREASWIVLGPRDNDEMQVFISEVLALYGTPEIMKETWMLLDVEMTNIGGGYDILEWDPNVQILFQVNNEPAVTPEEAINQPNTPLIAGVAIAAAAVLIFAALIVVWRVPRLRILFLPGKAVPKNLKSHMRKTEALAQREKQEAEASKIGEKKQWTGVRKPNDISNTLDP
jgi:hypothetical protein